MAPRPGIMRARTDATKEVIARHRPEYVAVMQRLCAERGLDWVDPDAAAAAAALARIEKALARFPHLRAEVAAPDYPPAG
jgi:hypothetical protein